jgi:hypothetical protein
MVVNFRAREISRGARKLTRTSTLNKKKNGRLGLVFFCRQWLILRGSSSAKQNPTFYMLYIRILYSYVRPPVTINNVKASLFSLDDWWFVFIFIFIFIFVCVCVCVCSWESPPRQEFSFLPSFYIACVILILDILCVGSKGWWFCFSCWYFRFKFKFVYLLTRDFLYIYYKEWDIMYSSRF